MVGINQGYGYGQFNRISTRGTYGGQKGSSSKGVSSREGGFNSSYSSVYNTASAMGTARKMRPSLLEDSSFENTATGLSSLTDSTDADYEGFAKGVSDFATRNTSNLASLKDSASALGRAASSINSSILVSTQTDIATIQAPSFSDGGEPLHYEIQINSLASGQQSQSAMFESEANSVFRLGGNNIILQTDNGDFQIDFTVAASDTNLDTLNVISEGINSAGMGITAEVATSDGQSTIQLASQGTGTRTAFDMLVPEGRSAAEKLEIRETSAAADAEYTINGQRFYSDTNTVPLPSSEGSTMSLHSTGGTTIRQVTDASGVVSAMQDFAASYNAAVSHLSGSSGQGSRSALRMIDGMNALSDNETARLSAMGIRADAENSLTVDEEKLTNAVRENPGMVRNTLSGSNSMTENVEEGAGRAMRISTASYADFNALLGESQQTPSGIISMMLPQPGFLIDYML